MRPRLFSNLLVVTTVVTTVVSASSAYPQGRLGVDFEPRLISIADGVYAYEGPLSLPGEEEIVRTNSLVVVTDAGVVVVDGQDNVEEAERMLGAIAEVTDQKVRYLVNASPHGDHVNGNAAFEGVTIVAHERARESMIHAAENAGNPPPPLPSVLFAERMELHVAGTTIELHYFGPAHTPGDTIVYLPEQKIAFLSEVYFNGVFTSLGDGFVKSHLEVLDEARALGADWFIPGHGYIEGQSREQLRAGLDRYAENVRVVYDAVLQHVEAGDSLLDTLAAIDGELGEFAEAPFYSFLKKRTVEGTYKALSAANQDR